MKLDWKRSVRTGSGEAVLQQDVVPGERVGFDACLGCTKGCCGPTEIYVSITDGEKWSERGYETVPHYGLTDSEVMAAMDAELERFEQFLAGWIPSTVVSLQEVFDSLMGG